MPLSHASPFPRWDCDWRKGFDCLKHGTSSNQSVLRCWLLQQLLWPRWLLRLAVARMEEWEPDSPPPPPPPKPVTQRRLQSPVLISETLVLDSSGEREEAHRGALVGACPNQGCMLQEHGASDSQCHVGRYGDTVLAICWRGWLCLSIANSILEFACHVTQTCPSCFCWQCVGWACHALPGPSSSQARAALTEFGGSGGCLREVQPRSKTSFLRRSGEGFQFTGLGWLGAPGLGGSRLEPRAEQGVWRLLMWRWMWMFLRRRLWGTATHHTSLGILGTCAE